MKFNEYLSKVEKLFSVSGPTERWKGIMKVTIAFQIFETKMKKSFTSTECQRKFRPSCRNSSWYTLISVSNNSYTCVPLVDTNTLLSKRPKFIYHAKGHSSEIPLRYFVVIFITLLPLPSWYYQFIFPNQNKNIFFVLIVSASLTQNIQERSLVYQMKSNADNLSANRHNVTSKSVYALTWNVLST